MKRVNLRNPLNNKVRTIKWGVSWSYLIFGGWALLFGGKFLWLLLEVFADALALTGVGAVVPVIYHIFLFLFGNKAYARHLYKKGWVVNDDKSKQIMGVE